MINTAKLRGVIVANELTQEKVAIHLGITPRTFSNKMQKGVFGSDEIEKMIDLLHIENPMEIFFAKEVT